jgi:hypothetical protein
LSYLESSTLSTFPGRHATLPTRADTPRPSRTSTPLSARSPRDGPSAFPQSPPCRGKQRVGREVGRHLLGHRGARHTERLLGLRALPPGQQKPRLFTRTAAATARASTGGNQNRDVPLRRPQRLRALPPGATKTGAFHSDGDGDCARFHHGQQQPGLFTQAAAATQRASTRGNKNRDFSLRRPRRLRAPPPGAIKTSEIFHSNGHGDGARLHRGQ